MLAVPRAVDAAPLVEGRSIAISEGLVFFRAQEAVLGSLRGTLHQPTEALQPCADTIVTW